MSESTIVNPVHSEVEDRSDTPLELTIVNCMRDEVEERSSDGPLFKRLYFNFMNCDEEWNPCDKQIDWNEKQQIELIGSWYTLKFSDGYYRAYGFYSPRSDSYSELFCKEINMHKFYDILYNPDFLDNSYYYIKISGDDSLIQIMINIGEDYIGHHYVPDEYTRKIKQKPATLTLKRIPPMTKKSAAKR